MKFEKWLETVPALKFCIALIIGILIGSSLQFNIFVLFILLVLLIILNVATKNQIYIFVLIFLFGIFKANLDFHQFSKTTLHEIPDSKNFEYTFRGTIADYPQYLDDNVRFIFESAYLISENDSIKITGNILATLWKNKFSKEEQPMPQLQIGDYVELTGKFSSPKPPSNPFEFNYRKYLYMHDIYKTLTLSSFDNVKVLDHNRGSFIFSKIINPARNYSEQILDKNYKGDNRGFIKGLITGNRTGISDEMKTSFIDTGIMHIIAVSGLNVAYVILLITLCLSILRLPKNYILVTTIPLLILYCLFTGATPSIVRATTMGILFIIAYLIEKKIVFYNIVAVSAIVILVYDSKQLFDAGFILSFVSLISMVFIYETVFRQVENKIFKYRFTNNFLFRWLFLLIVISTAAIIGTIPVSASYFGKISIVSIAANIIAVPVSNFVLATGFLQILVSLFSDYLSNIISYTNNFAMNILSFIIDWLSSLKFAFIEFYKFNIVNLIFTYIILILLATMRKENFVFRLSVTVILCAGIFLSNYNFNKTESITFLDAKNDDAVVVNADTKNLILYSDKDKNSFDRVVIPYLKKSENGNSNIFINVNKPNSLSVGTIYNLSDDLKIYMLSPAQGEINNASAIIKYRNENILYLNSINPASTKYFFVSYKDLLTDNITYISKNDSLFSYDLVQSDIYFTSNNKLNGKLSIEENTSFINLNETGAVVLKMNDGEMKFYDWRN
ncbi:MAG TPA: ComEC/Rec2 family competence protein [Ignavibacteria bacterium]|nr:ComEC/Rec2 family competence protein [Ignavibacteria bacterium]